MKSVQPNKSPRERREALLEEKRASSCTSGLPCSVPAWVADEIKATWRAARDAGGEMAAFRIIERMVDRLGYGRIENNPSLAPNPSHHDGAAPAPSVHGVVGHPN